MVSITQECEHAIHTFGKVKIRDRFFHTLGKRYLTMNQAIRKAHACDEAGYSAIARRAAPHDPRWEVLVRRRKTIRRA